MQLVTAEINLRSANRIKKLEKIKLISKIAGKKVEIIVE
jgi:hypothetical protein